MLTTVQRDPYESSNSHVDRYRARIRLTKWEAPGTVCDNDKHQQGQAEWPVQGGRVASSSNVRKIKTQLSRALGSKRHSQTGSNEQSLSRQVPHHFVEDMTLACWLGFSSFLDFCCIYSQLFQTASIFLLQGISCKQIPGDLTCAPSQAWDKPCALLHTESRNDEA